MHIADENFRDLTFAMNLTDCLEQTYRDDGVEGRIWAKLTCNTVEVSSCGVPLSKLQIYTDCPTLRVIVNGKPWHTEKHVHYFLASREV